jgi:hypothetical protein
MAVGAAEAAVSAAVENIAGVAVILYSACVPAAATSVFLSLFLLDTAALRRRRAAQV